MNLKELKLKNIDHIKVVNCPGNINLGIASTDENIEVVIYFVDELSDVKKFVEYCSSIKLPADNTTILLYKKGRNDVNLESIFAPFRDNVYSNFKLKLPVLGTLNPGYLGALIMSKVS